MSLRQIILDTETTGLRVEEGHRVIEIGCLEMIDRKLTGKHFQCYLNPEREVEAGALEVHGITNAFLQDKPFFRDIVQELMEFISQSELIIHNAPFDLSFLNHELVLADKQWKNISQHCRVIDTLQLARQLHVGQRNSLDVLCKRYGVDNSKREWHGALLDAHLLSQVYLAMTGGQGSFFDSHNQRQTNNAKSTDNIIIKRMENHCLVVLKADKNELFEHKKYIDLLNKQSKSTWSQD